MSSDWVPPKAAEDTYDHLSGNRFAGTNSDSAGPRETKELPKGKAEFQLYSLATPNGQKASIGLEEFEVQYDAHLIDISKGDQFTSGFIEINPNGRIPAMLHGSTRVFESGSILLYLAEREKKFLPEDPAKRAECMSWLFWQMGGQGPMCVCSF